MLDFLSDIGGLYGIIFAFIASLLGFINFNYLDNYMVTKLFKIEKASDSKDSKDDDEFK